jgi:hypothetical protein
MHAAEVYESRVLAVAAAAKPKQLLYLSLMG